MTSLVRNFNQLNNHYLPSLPTDPVLDVNRISVHQRQAIMSDHEKDSVQSFSAVQRDTNGDSQDEDSCLPHINIDPKELNIGIREEPEKSSVKSEEDEEALVKHAKTCTEDAGERLVGVTEEKVKSAPEDSLSHECDSHSNSTTTITSDRLSQDKSNEQENHVQSEPLQNADTYPEDASVSEDGDNLPTPTAPTSNGVDGLENSTDNNVEVSTSEKGVEVKSEDANSEDARETETNNSDSLQFDGPSEESTNANSDATSQPEEQKQECKRVNSQSESASPSPKTERAAVSDDSNKNQNNNSQSLPLHCTTSFTSISQNGHLSPTGGLSNGVGGDHSVSSSPGTSTSSLSSTLSQTAIQGPMSPGSGPASATPAGPHSQHPAHTRVNTPPNNLQCHVHTVYNHQASSPTRFSPNGPSRGESPHSGASGPGSPPSQQHVVHVHVNQGETFSVRVGDQIQHIQGPATVRMVSNNGPPLPMPMQVPPGHMVQQIVDEHGILTHVILSPQPPGMPGSPMTGGPNNGAQYYPPYGPPYPSPPQYSTHHHPHPGAGTPPHMHPGVHHAHIHPPPPSHNCNNHASAHSAGPSSSPASHHLDERTVRQRDKMKAKYDRRVQDGYYQSGPAPSRRTKSKPNKGVSQTMATLSTSPTQNGDDIEEERRELQQQLTSMPAPKISDVEARSALIQLDSPDYDQSVYDLINPADFCYELLLSEKGRDGKYKPVYTKYPGKLGDATEITLKDLKPATEYFLKASTLLDDIRGSPTDPVSFKTLCCEPDPPQSPRLSQKTKTSITLKWNSTAENGARIQTYTLECDQGQGEGHFVEVYEGLSRQFRLSKLQASTRYLFRLAAVNSMGKSGYSETSSFYTSGSVPSQPDPPMLSEAFVNALTISWIKRPNDDDFTLHMEDECTGHGFITVYNGPNLSHIVKTLRRNSEYRFKLAARNEEGQGKWSDVVCYKTLPDRPGPPVKPQSKGKVYAQSFRVTWDPPKDDGGSEVTSYTVEMDDGGGYDIVYNGPDREYVCERLTPGHSYRVRAKCRSAGGVSDYSECCTVTTQAVAPGQCQPPKLQGKPKASSLHLRWNYPEKDGGAQVTDFTAQMSFPDNTSREVYRGRDLDCIVAGLSPGRPYLFQVRAHNKAGAGPWSDPLEVVSGAGVPDAPKAPVVTCKSPHSAIISWEEPVNNGATISEYKLEWLQRADFDYIQLYLGSSQSYEVRGLIPASQYSFRVQAINSAGSGPFSSPVTCVTPSSSPAPVVSIRYSAAATTIALTWKEPNCNGSEIIAYNIDVGEKNLTVVSSITEHTLEGLSPETTYKIRIQAVNDIGVGAFSAPIKVTTRALPPNPPRLECISTLPNSLKLRWGDGRNQDMVKYTLEMEKEDGSFVAIHTGPAHTHKVNKLSELTSYEFRIFASNDAGDGPYSDTFTFTTTKAPPPALKAPRVSETGLSHCVLEWTGIKPIGSDCIHYLLQIQALAAKEVEYKEVYRGPNTSYRLTNLSPRTEYQARVCAVRQSTSRSGDITGAFSPGTVFNTLSPAPQRTLITKTVETKISEPKQLTDQQWAMIILFGFVLFAVLVAFIAQQIISYTSHTSSRQ
ncbi:fibronectin type-III domain-containing protein 3A-like isoform X3 [Liolophura sinensis]|uniref:fibronectin type-III domain-containing protein 3A-like isoform X3 n=1 Tax=Liolophura sinensis TaxID=3198878 RepID=UPI0031586DD2